MGPGQKFDPDWVIFLLLGLVWVRHSDSGKFPSKIPNFHFLVKKYVDQSRVGPLFTAGQKYARVGWGNGHLLID